MEKEEVSDYEKESFYIRNTIAKTALALSLDWLRNFAKKGIVA